MHPTKSYSVIFYQSPTPVQAQTDSAHSCGWETRSKYVKQPMPSFSCLRQDLNLGPLGFQPSALPSELQGLGARWIAVLHLEVLPHLPGQQPCLLVRQMTGPLDLSARATGPNGCPCPCRFSAQEDRPAPLRHLFPQVGPVMSWNRREPVGLPGPPPPMYIL